MAAGSLKKHFGRIVRRRREAAGMSQEALALEAGLHPTYISLLERGLRNPSLVTVQVLAGSLETTMASLVRELESELAR